MTYKASGRVLHIGNVVDHTEKFKSQTIVLQIDGQYPQEVPFQFSNSRIDLLSGITLNSEVTISFEITGRATSQGERRWFSALNGFNINKN